MYCFELLLLQEVEQGRRHQEGLQEVEQGRRHQEGLQRTRRAHVAFQYLPAVVLERLPRSLAEG